MLTPASHIALLGFGPAANRIAAVLAPRGQALRAFDLRLRDPATAGTLRLHIEAAGVDPAVDPEAALRGVRLVIVEQMPLLDELPAHVRHGQVVLDLSGASAAQCAAGSAGVRAAGAYYLRGRMTADEPLLQLSGERAATVAAALEALGLRATVGAGTDDVAPLDATAHETLLPGTPVVRRGELP